MEPAVELSWPIALLLLAAALPAWWLSRRAAGRTATHPLWFLAPPGAPARGRRGGVRRSRLLLVAAIVLIAAASAGPIAIDRGGARVLVVDLSATRALDRDTIVARLRDFDEVVLAAPGAPPRRIPARDAAGAIEPARATLSAAELAAAVDAALPGARTIELAPAPPPGDNAGIVAARFHRDPLAPGRGRIVVALRLAGATATPRAVVASAGRIERARANVVRDDRAIDDSAIDRDENEHRGVAVLPYEGAGSETLTIAIETAGADRLVMDDTATIDIPSVRAMGVWIEPSLAAHAIARALAVLPTVTRIAEPSADAIAIVRSSAWTGPARARVVIHAPPIDAPIEPLLAVPGAPLPGLTVALLAAAPAVAIDPAAGGAATPDSVWLRAGPHAAVWIDGAAAAGSAPTLHVAAAIDGAVLPVLIADAFAAPPLAPAADAADVADVRAPPVAPGVPAPHRPRRGWPLRVLLVIAAIAIAIEAVLGRARGAAAIVRAGVVVGLAVLAWRAVGPAPRRVVFVVDVSASAAPADADARAVIARAAGSLARDDRASVVVVAGGAARAIGPATPGEVAAWARRGRIDPRALGVDPARTELATGLALAGELLGGAGGSIVLVGDGRDRAGIAAVRDAPALIGRGFTFVPIDAGDLARVEVRAGTLRAAPGRAFALPVAIETRIATTVAVTATHRGRVLAQRSVAVAAGTTALALPLVLDTIDRDASDRDAIDDDTAGVAEIDVAIAVEGDPIAATDRARVRVELARGPRRLRIGAADAGALTPAALEAIETVVLEDVPGPALSPTAIDALDRFVRGGGTLVWSAGPEVARAGVGPIERWLPLRAPRRPRLALMLLVDRSGSVAAAATGGAVAGAAELAAAAAALGPDDWFGALAFDVAPSVWIPLGPARAAQVVPELAPPRGGTDPSAALAEAAVRLAAAPADARRVVVVVSDGGFPATAERAQAAAAALGRDGIRVDVIAAGAPDDAARARLASLTTAGGAVHDLRGAIAGVLPAIDASTQPPAAPGPIRIRAAWATWLGAPPAIAAASASDRSPSAIAAASANDRPPPAATLSLRPAPDAIVLADAGDDPLVAVRAHGLGAVLAYAAPLPNRDPRLAPVADAIASAATVQPPLDLEATLVDGTLALRATTASAASTIAATDDAPLPAVAYADQRAFPFLLVPAAPGTFTATLPAPASDRVTILAPGARSQVLLPDPEHRALGADLAITALARRAPPDPLAQPWAPTPVLAALAIAILLGILALRR